MILDFETIYRAFPWVAIANCPGSYVLKGSQYRNISPEALLDISQAISVFLSAQASDKVKVLPLVTGGLICYRKPDGSYVHTLGNEEGFRRKLAQLGVFL